MMETKNNVDDDDFVVVVVKVVTSISLLTGYYYFIDDGDDDDDSSPSSTSSDAANDPADNNEKGKNGVKIILKTNEKEEDEEEKFHHQQRQQIILLKHQSSTALTTDGGITTDDDDDDYEEDDENNDHNDDDNNIIKSFQQRIMQQQQSKEIMIMNSSSDDDLNNFFYYYYEQLFTDTKQLLRILIARKFDIEEAEKLFWEQHRFRSRWKPDQILKERPHDIQIPLASGAWRLCGYSRKGHVISNYKLKYWDPINSFVEDDGGVNQYVKYVIYMIELMISSKNMTKQQNEEEEVDKFIVLFDLNGFVLSWIFSRRVRLMIRKLVYIAQAQYPERLEKVYLINSPKGFESAWFLIKGLLDEKTVSKIHFLATNKTNKSRRRSTSQLLCSSSQQPRSDNNNINNTTTTTTTQSNNIKIDRDDNDNDDDICFVIDPYVLSIEYGGMHPEYPLP